MTIKVIVMCKAPIVGKVKTRLISDQIDAAHACALHQQMATVVIQRANLLFPAATIIATDNPDHPFFHPFHLPVVPQGDGDLGLRMQRLGERWIDQHALLFLGTDSPHMQPTRLQQAVALAASHDAVAGPVEDGGYDLLLLNHRKSMALLHHIPWGSSRVWQQTCLQAADANLTLGALDMGFDIDDHDDLQRAQRLKWQIKPEKMDGGSIPCMKKNQ